MVHRESQAVSLVSRGTNKAYLSCWCEDDINPLMRVEVGTWNAVPGREQAFHPYGFPSLYSVMFSLLFFMAPIWNQRSVASQFVTWSGIPCDEGPGQDERGWVRAQRKIHLRFQPKRFPLGLLGDEKFEICRLYLSILCIVNFTGLLLFLADENFLFPSPAPTHPAAFHTALRDSAWFSTGRPAGGFSFVVGMFSLWRAQPKPSNWIGKSLSLHCSRHCAHSHLNGMNWWLWGSHIKSYKKDKWKLSWKWNVFSMRVWKDWMEKHRQFLDNGFLKTRDSVLRLLTPPWPRKVPETTYTY